MLVTEIVMYKAGYMQLPFPDKALPATLRFGVVEIVEIFSFLDIKIQGKHRLEGIVVMFGELP